MDTEVIVIVAIAVLVIIVLALGLARRARQRRQAATRMGLPDLGALSNDLPTSKQPHDRPTR